MALNDYRDLASCSLVASIARAGKRADERLPQKIKGGSAAGASLAADQAEVAVNQKHPSRVISSDIACSRAKDHHLSTNCCIASAEAFARQHPENLERTP